MTILAIDTSTPQGSVALLDDGAVKFSEVFTGGRSHSSQLFAVLERALSTAPVIDQIVVGLGPGSYAGVRIAISAAVGLAAANGAKLVGIPSVVALEEREYIALGDARRQSFYFASIRNGVCLEGPILATAEELHAKLAQCGQLPIYISEPLPEVPQAELRFPSAERLARLAAAGCSVIAHDDLEPIYLRDPYITLPKVK